MKRKIWIDVNTHITLNTIMPTGNFVLYIWRNKITKKPLYIGIGSKDRPQNHNNDLLSIELGRNLDKYECIIEENLSIIDVSYIEAFIIKYYDNKYGLHDYGCYAFDERKVINKRHERRYENDNPLRINVVCNEEGREQRVLSIY